MAPAEAASPLRIEVVWDAAPHGVRRIALRMSPGATAGDALRASGLLASQPALAGAPMGIWGRACGPEAPLRDQDRVELYRGLTVDPKEARRRRQAAKR